MAILIPLVAPTWNPCPVDESEASVVLVIRNVPVSILVNVPTEVILLKFPVVITVPVISGKVIVLAAVGAVLVSVVIKLAPSNSISPVILNCLVDLNLPTSTISPPVCLVAKPIAVCFPEPSLIAPILAALTERLLDDSPPIIKIPAKLFVVLLPTLETDISEGIDV